MAKIITATAKKRLSAIGLNERDVEVVYEYGKSAHAKHDGYFYYIPKNKTKKNRDFEKYDGVYMLFIEDSLIEVFKSQNFKLLK